MKTLILPVMAGLLSLTLATAQTGFYPPLVEDGRLADDDLAVVDAFAVLPNESKSSNAWFPGFKEYAHQNLRYPRPALESGVEGVVSAEAVVEADGKLTAVRITEGLSFSCDREVVRLLTAMPAWHPARRDGAAISQKVFIRVRFRLKSN